MKRRTFLHNMSYSSLGLSIMASPHFPTSKPTDSPADRPIGMIGLDTSHAPAFTKIFNDPEAAEDVAGFRITHAYPHGSRDIESSSSRIPKYTQEMQGLGVEITESIEELLEKVDFVLLETNDGRLHLEQAKLVFEAGKAVFIDKPIAASLEDAVEIFELSNKHEVPMFSASSLRFGPATQEVAKGSTIGKVLGADTYSPAKLEPTHPDLFWYGVHGVESLFTVMGTGCKQVRRIYSEGVDIVVGEWDDGRIGTFRGIREGKSGYGGTAFGENGAAPAGVYEGYRPLLVEIANFFRTGIAPVSEQETLEIFAFMSAAEESKRLNGLPVSLEATLQAARR